MATNPEPLSLLQMAQAAMGTGDNPYGGRTMAQTVIGGIPFADLPDVNPGGYAANAANWSNQPATNELVSEAIQRGAQYQPEFARQVQSSGPEGGFFSIPGMEAATQIPWGTGGAGQALDWGPNPAPGLMGMSTNNPRLLPKQYQTPQGQNPQYAMRAGHIIDRYMADKPGEYVAQRGSPPVPQILQLGRGGHGFPLSFGMPFGPRGSFFPGQLEPWTPEGGPGGMGTGVT